MPSILLRERTRRETIGGLDGDQYTSHPTPDTRCTLRNSASSDTSSLLHPNFEHIELSVGADRPAPVCSATRTSWWAEQLWYHWAFVPNDYSVHFSPVNDLLSTG